MSEGSGCGHPGCHGACADENLRLYVNHAFDGLVSVVGRAVFNSDKCIRARVPIPFSALPPFGESAATFLVPIFLDAMPFATLLEITGSDKRADLEEAHRRGDAIMVVIDSEMRMLVSVFGFEDEQLPAINGRGGSA